MRSPRDNRARAVSIIFINKLLNFCDYPSNHDTSEVAKSPIVNSGLVPWHRDLVVNLKLSFFVFLSPI